MCYKESRRDINTSSLPSYQDESLPWFSAEAFPAIECLSTRATASASASNLPVELNATMLVFSHIDESPKQAWTLSEPICAYTYDLTSLRLPSYNISHHVRRRPSTCIGILGT